MATKKQKLVFSSENQKAGTLKAAQKVQKLLSSKDAWIQGSYSNYGDTAFCLMGAIGYVNGPFENNVLAAVIAALNEPIFDKTFSELNDGAVVRYNDAKTRTHKDITKVLAKTVKLIESSPVDKKNALQL